MNNSPTGLDDPTREIIIYGAGDMGSRLVAFLTARVKAGNRIRCFFDSNPLKDGGALLGIPVSLPSAAHRDGNPLVILAQERASQLELMRATCQKLGYETIDAAVVMGTPIEDAWTFTPKPPAPTDFVNMDIIDSCNLSCANCLRIYRNPENIAANIMSRDTFNRILDKSVQIGFANVGFINWTESFLHPDVANFARDCTRRGLGLIISSNLSLPEIPALLPTLENCLHFKVSVSGFTQETHSRNHRGSNIETVKKHLETIARAKRRGTIQTRIDVKFLDFEYNRGEVERFRKYAADLDLPFSVHHGMLHTPCKPDYYSEIKKLFVKMMDNYTELRKKSLMAKCHYLDMNPVVDYKGDAYLCCACLSLPFFKVGNFIEDDYALLQALRQTHPFCALCGMDWSRALADENTA